MPGPPHTGVLSPGGVKPEGHGDDHEMVSMEFTCDHCQGLIVGRRMNCNVCDDFDLCYGCYAAKKYSYGYARHLPRACLCSLCAWREGPRGRNRFHTRAGEDASAAVTQRGDAWKIVPCVLSCFFLFLCSSVLKQITDLRSFPSAILHILL